MSPAPRRRRLERAGCCALRPRRERPCGTPQRPRGARRIVRRRPAAAWQIADARALAAAPALPAKRRIEPRRLETGTPELVLATSDSWFASSSGPEPGHTGQRSLRAKTLAARTVLFHPDCHRRLRNCTESADPSSSRKKALAGSGRFSDSSPLPPVGNFTPP